MNREGWDGREGRRPTVDDLGDPPTTARWLAWATAFLLVIAVVAAGVMNIAGPGNGDGLVTAAGRADGTFVVPTTALPAPVPPTLAPAAPAPTVARSTTIPKAAAAILKAIGTTTPTSPAPATTTTSTAPAAPTTTVKPTPSTTTSTTSTTLAPRATVTVANDLTQTFVIVVDGRTFEVAAGQEAAPFDLALPADGRDSVQVKAKDEPACQAGAVGHLFDAGGRYRLAVVAGSGTACQNSAAPDVKVTPIRTP
jgi:hypothetical protein